MTNCPIQIVLHLLKDNRNVYYFQKVNALKNTRKLDFLNAAETLKTIPVLTKQEMVCYILDRPKVRSGTLQQCCWS